MSSTFQEESDRCADMIDAASAITETFTRNSEAAARAKAAPQQKQNADGTWPVTECECGVEIVPARLALGRIKCVACQTEQELRERQYGRR